MLKIAKKIKTYPGLGDSVLIYPIAKWFLSKNSIVKVETKFGDVFIELEKNSLFSSSEELSHPTVQIDYKNQSHTNKNIFEDICHLAGVPDIEFALDHPGGKIRIPYEYCVVKPPYFKYTRHNDTTPEPNQVQETINFIQKHMPVILVRHKDDIGYKFDNVKEIKVDNVSDLIGIIKSSSLSISQHGHFQHIAESLSIKSLVLFSSKMKKSELDSVKMMSPKKVIIKKSTRYLFDDDCEFHRKLRQEYENWFG